MLKSLRKTIKQFGQTNCYGCKEFHLVAEPNEGFRPDMQDQYFVLDDFFKSQNKSILFAVADGHGGGLVSKFIKENLLQAFKAAQKTFPKDIPKMFTAAFKRLDQQIQTIKQANQCGSTLTVGLIYLDQARRVAAVANVGDSSAYIFDDKSYQRLTHTHRCDDQHQNNRVKKQGGKIVMNRLSGMLSVTRALGDLQFRGHGLSAQPSFKRLQLRLSHRWLVVASDGLWDYVQMQQCLKVMRGCDEANEVSRSLCRMAVNNGSADNITILVIKL